MENLNPILSADKRSIELCYKTIDEEYDNNIFHKVMEIVRKAGLSCTTTKVTNSRCFHIHGIFPKDVVEAYGDIERLN